MKRIIVGLAACVLLSGVILLAQTGSGWPGTSGWGLQVMMDEVNPWTNLKINRHDNQFQFVIVSDRTGGHRSGVFSRAVHQINLLQPEFIVSVGDLVEGGGISYEDYDRQWKEFQNFTSQLTMPFFYVPGNHDASHNRGVVKWQDKFDKLYHSFVYKDVLFLCLNSNDGPAQRREDAAEDDFRYRTGIGEQQRAFIRKTLEMHAKVRWTLVFLHHPVWAVRDPQRLEENGWAEVEGMLKDRDYTVFCGHVHRYRKYIRQGKNYYQLATTGGGSRLRGTSFGEFDHIVWVTMKDDGPVLANIMLDSLYPENLKLLTPEETGNPQPGIGLPTRPGRGRLTLDGEPVEGMVINFYPAERPQEGEQVFPATGTTDKDGLFRLQTYAADGILPGKYRVTIERPNDIIQGLTQKANPVPEKYRNTRTSGLEYEIKPESWYEFNIELSSSD